MKIVLSRNQITVGSVLTAIAAIGAAAAVFGIDVPGLLPMSRAAHAQDVERHAQQHSAEQTALLAAVNALGAKIDLSDRRQQCAALAEEMQSIRFRLAALQDSDQEGGEEWIERQQRLDALAERTGSGNGGLRCVEFVQ